MTTHTISQDEILAMVERPVALAANRLISTFNLCRTCLDDLIQTGRLIALEIARKYDPARGAAFSTFASRTIYSRLAEHAKKMTTQLGGVGMKARVYSVALDAPLPDHAGTVSDSIGLTASDDTIHLAIYHEEREALARALETLPENQLEIIHRVYMQGQSYAQIAAVLGCSRQAIQQHHEKALRKLRDGIRDTPSSATSGA